MLKRDICSFVPGKLVKVYVATLALTASVVTAPRRAEVINIGIYKLWKIGQV